MFDYKNCTEEDLLKIKIETLTKKLNIAVKRLCEFCIDDCTECEFNEYKEE